MARDDFQISLTSLGRLTEALEEELAVGKQREAEIRFELDRVRQAKKEAECR